MQVVAHPMQLQHVDAIFHKKNYSGTTMDGALQLKLSLHVPKHMKSIFSTANEVLKGPLRIDNSTWCEKYVNHLVSSGQGSDGAEYLYMIKGLCFCGKILHHIEHHARLLLSRQE